MPINPVNQDKRSTWVANSYGAEWDSNYPTGNHTAPPSTGVIFSDDFSSGSIKLNDPSGFYWARMGNSATPMPAASTANYTVQSLPAPHADKKGIVMTYPGVPWGNGTPPQLAYMMGGNYFEVWHRFSLFIPTNFMHRSLVGCSIGSALSAPQWNVGDTVQSVNGATSGQITGFDTATNVLWIENALNIRDDKTWGKGTITNLTTGATATNTARVGSPTNHKWSITWQGQYSSNGFGYETEQWANIDSSWNKGSCGTNVNVTSTDTTPYSKTHLGNSDGTNLVLVDPTIDAGKLLEFTVHTRKSTTSTSYDGVVQMWRRRVTDNGSLDLILSNNTNVLSWDSVANYQDRGYILGAANGGFTQSTTFYFTDFFFYGANVPTDIPAGEVL